MVSIVLRDVKGTFDKVWHNGLRFKLGNIQLEGYLKRILSNYLEVRKGFIFYKAEKEPMFKYLCNIILTYETYGKTLE